MNLQYMTWVLGFLLQVVDANRLLSTTLKDICTNLPSPAHTIFGRGSLKQRFCIYHFFSSKSFNSFDMNNNFANRIRGL